MSKILVCGGREFDDWDLLYTTLYDIFDNGKRSLNEPLIIIEGGATGADFLARVWAKYMSIEFPVSYKEYKADWKTYGRSAGPIRNQQMLDENPDIEMVVAFPGGVGTNDMVERSVKKGLEVIQIV